MCMFSWIRLNNRTNHNTQVIIVITMVCGIANIFLIGNLNYIRLLVLFLSFFVGKLFLNDSIEPKPFLNVFWIYTAFIVIRIFTQGLGQAVFTYVSNNYASVYLLCPLIIYYIKNERKQEKIDLIPAIVLWFICAFTTSRMGLLTASFILGGLILYGAKKANGRFGPVIILIVIILFIIPLIPFVLPILLSKYSDLYIIQRFMNIGLTSPARTRMWTEYFELLKNTKYLLFGAPTSEVYWAARFYEGNLHNSYLIVHAYLGILGFLGLVILIAKSYRFGVKKKNWVYLIMLTAFCVRSYTDHVFGCNRISPIIIFLIFLPFLPEYNTEFLFQKDQLEISGKKKNNRGGLNHA